MRGLIIGGGIGGLSAAIAMRRVGIEAFVFEQADALREVGASGPVGDSKLKTARAAEAVALGKLREKLNTLGKADTAGQVNPS